ncbi:MAG TPA: DNA polymerase IV [Firmicutes bacterium]|nr:DNA polymerase IV [Bacillota bacterium]
MNAFFAACHQAQEPALKGKPVLVSGDPSSRHGIVLTASYEARRFGVKTAMPTAQALRLCPQALIVAPNFRLYSFYSKQIMAILNSFTPLVEQYSIDEAWLDVSGCENLFGPADNIAREIKQKIKHQLDLSCSIGIAPSKILAKMASDLEKPDGLVIITADNIASRIWPLAVDKLFGVGPQTTAALNSLGVFTIGDLAGFPLAVLKQRFGAYGPYLAQLAQGQDHSSVDPNPDTAKSIGNSITLPQDAETAAEIETILLALAEEVGTRLRRRNLKGSTITVSVKTPDFRLITRSRTYPEATNLTETIYRRAGEIYRQHLQGQRVRLVGVTVSNITAASAGTQLSLFPASEDDKRARLAQTVDQVRARFGDRSLVRARLLHGPQLPKK